MESTRRALVVGFRRTGRAVAALLAARGTRVRVSDTQPAAALGSEATAVPAGVELRLGEDGPDLLAGIDLVVPSPGVPREAPILRAAVAAGIPIVSEIELAARGLAAPIVAVTGTNGKSTTTTLVGLALARAGRRVFVGGNLGTPLVDAVGRDVDVAVAEVSSFQLEWVDAFRPAVAALLNVTPDHLDRHASFEEYRDLKARIFARQEAADWAVVNRDDPEVAAIAARCRARVVSFGWGPSPLGAHVAGDEVVLRLPGAAEERVSLAATRLTGRHNVENILAAATIARLAGAPLGAVQEAVDTMEPLPHRLARVGERRGVVFVDDSKATNVGAAAKSLGSVGGPVILLAGGVDKGGSYDALAAAASGRVRLACLFGAARERIAAALDECRIPVERTASLEEAVAAAASAARPGDTVLLAPACASFDMFADYAARGRAFRAAVEALP
jgi:UDP-N-acetylmuramoylalanine--D-glutamate ligase